MTTESAFARLESALLCLETELENLNDRLSQLEVLAGVRCHKCGGDLTDDEEDHLLSMCRSCRLSM